MTDADYQAEWTYLFQERLGMLCGTAQPTLEQTTLASDAADAIMAMHGGPAKRDFIPAGKQP